MLRLRHIGTSEEAGKVIAKALVPQRGSARLCLRLCCSLPRIIATERDAAARATTPYAMLCYALILSGVTQADTQRMTIAGRYFPKEQPESDATSKDDHGYHRLQDTIQLWADRGLLGESLPGVRVKAFSTLDSCLWLSLVDG